MTQGGKGFGFGQFNEPRGVYAGRDNRVYVADTFNHRIQVFNALGDFQYAFGSQGDGEAEFKEPNDVILDASGRIVVVDTWNNRLQVFDGKGRYLDLWAGDQGLYAPRAITQDPVTGRFYLADTGNGQVRVLDASGEMIGRYGGRGTGPGRLNNPTGIACHDGRVYVLDRDNRRVVVLDREARYLSEFPIQFAGGWLGEPKLAVTHDGRILVSDVSGRRVLVYTAQGKLATTLGGPHVFEAPVGLGVSPAGNLLYVTDMKADRVVITRVPAP